MMKANLIIEALEKEPGKLAKRQILKNAWNDHRIEEFFTGAYLANNPYITFGVKQIPTKTSWSGIVNDLNDSHQKRFFADFMILTEKLINRKLSGNAARDAIQEMMDSPHVARDQWNHFYRRVLMRDLGCGVSGETITEVLMETGDKDAVMYYIPSFDVQLAKKGIDHPKKLVGKKFLDAKLDGVRLITILNKEDGTVRQFTRNGHENTNFRDITEILKKHVLPVIKESFVLDGEIISKDFQSLMTQVNRTSSVDTSTARLACFDILKLVDFKAGIALTPQDARDVALSNFVSKFEKELAGKIFRIPKFLVDLDTKEGRDFFRSFNKTALDDGYEGIMIKDPKGPYEGKRTFSWLKHKPTLTIDMEILEVQQGFEGKYSGTTGALVGFCYDEEGRYIESAVGTGISDDLRDEIWANRFSIPGRIMEVEADAVTKSRDGKKNQKGEDIFSLRFPRFKMFRDLGAGTGKI